MKLKQGEIPAFFVSYKGSSRKVCREFHAESAKSFMQRVQRASRRGRKELLRNTGVQIIIKRFLGFEHSKGVVQKLF